jgi:hypothetical protein
MLFTERGGSPAISELGVGGQDELGSGSERSQVPELLDIVFAGRAADIISNQKDIGLLEFHAAAVSKTGVAAFGFENIAS